MIKMGKSITISGFRVNPKDLIQYSSFEQEGQIYNQKFFAYRTKLPDGRRVIFYWGGEINELEGYAHMICYEDLSQVWSVNYLTEKRQAVS